MTARALNKEAEALGAKVAIEATIEWTEIQVTAPDGHVFKASGTHFLVDSGRTGPRAMSIIAARILPDVLQGVEPCTDQHCEICGRQ